MPYLTWKDYLMMALMAIVVILIIAGALVSGYNATN